jgi:hypothetical protein
MVLPMIQNEYKPGAREIINTLEIEKRNQERNKFLEFHYALCGLLLYEKRYHCINRIFNHTTSTERFIKRFV